MNLLKKTILTILCISMSITLIQPMQIHAFEDDINPIEETYIEEEAYVLDEDETQRSEYSKDFIMSDKTTQKIIYAIPVHYEEEGEWKEIDNTLISSVMDETDDEVLGYQTSQSKTKIKFSKKCIKRI